MKIGFGGWIFVCALILFCVTPVAQAQANQAGQTDQTSQSKKIVQASGFIDYSTPPPQCARSSILTIGTFDLSSPAVSTRVKQLEIVPFFSPRGNSEPGSEPSLRRRSARPWDQPTMSRAVHS